MPCLRIASMPNSAPSTVEVTVDGPVDDAKLAEVREIAADVFSNAVIEHVETLENQRRMADEIRRVLDEGVRGHNDLYVALTRATQRLGVLSPGELPPELSRLA